MSAPKVAFIVSSRKAVNDNKLYMETSRRPLRRRRGEGAERTIRQRRRHEPSLDVSVNSALLNAIMELSERTIRGLENVQNASLVDDETFVQLLDIVCADLVRKNDATKSITRIYGSKPDVIKCAYADVTSLFVEAARHKLDAENLSTFFHSAKIFGPRAEKLCELYAKHKEPIVAQLGEIGDGPPSVVDVDWRLDYCVKSSTNNSIGECLYHVRLATKKHAKLEHIQFTCTTQQLQDLVYKLKEAARHVDKIANS